MNRIRYWGWIAALTGIIGAPKTGFGLGFSGGYEIVNQHSGMVLEVAAFATNAGAYVDQWIGNGGSNQHWTLTSLGNGAYEIINANSGLALEVNAAATTNGAPVDQGTWTGGANQQWMLSPLGNGNYEIINQNSGLALEIAGGSINNYAAVDQEAYSGAANQQWLVLPLKIGGTVSAASGGSGLPASSFHGFNWADARDNFVDGALLLSGMGITNSYSEVQNVAQAVLGAFQNVGANTVRMPINPETVIGSWWSSYRGAIDEATAMGMKVILGTWTSQSAENGTVNDPVTFWRMWDTVVTNYNGNGRVYFEILNEPFGYSTEDWLTVVTSWLQRYPTVARGRVLVGGTGYCADIPAVASSPITSGCLYSVHDYGFWNSSLTTDAAWFNSLSNEVGGYMSSTVLTEYGAPTTAGYNYAGGDQGNNYISSVIGFCDYCQSTGIGAIYWPGLRDGDGYSLFSRNTDTMAMSLNSPSSLDLLKYAWSGFNGSGTYQIVNGNSGLALAVAGGAVDSGAGVVQVPWSGGTSQQWSLRTLGGGFDMIVNQNSGLVLEVRGAVTGNGAVIDQAMWNGANNQQWAVTSLADGFYQILNRNSGLALEVYAWATNNGAEVDQWSYDGGANQVWTFGPATPPPLQIQGALANGIFQVIFTNAQADASYTLLATTNLALPLGSWTVVSTASNLPAGVVELSDPAAGNPGRFYMLRSP